MVNFISINLNIANYIIGYNSIKCNDLLINAGERKATRRQRVNSTTE